MNVGKDSVVIGKVSPHAQVGDGSVVVGATDANGNTILNQSMAVGRGASAGQGSIAIGAQATSGVTQDIKRWWERPVGIVILSVLAAVVAGAVLFYTGWH